MINYYPPGPRLQAELRRQLGIECGIVGPDAGGKFAVHYPPGTPQNVQDQGNAIAATWPNTMYRSRLLWDIWQQLNTLTTKQQNSITTDLQTGSPPKQFAVEQPNTTAAFSSWQVSSGASMTSATFYVQDNPMYLINPPFDPSISVPGWEPVP